MKTFSKYDTDYTIKFANYTDGNTAIIGQETGGDYIMLTTNISRLPIQLAAIDINNNRDAVELLTGLGVIEKDPVQVIHSGFCTYPVHKITDEMMEQLKEDCKEYPKETDEKPDESDDQPF